MNRSAWRQQLAAILSCLGLLTCCACETIRDGTDFVPIFNGRTLADWRADPASLGASWSVRDGAIQGKGIEDRLAYLVYSGDEELRDFELKFSYRMLTDGNTGVELRARVDPTGRRPFVGYHADLGHVGIGAMILGAWDFHFATREEFPCERGTSLVIAENGTATWERLDNPVSVEDIRERDWNQCHLVAIGNRFRFMINGKVSSEFVDRISEGRLESGFIAVQLHEKGTIVQFKDILLRRLD